MTGPAEFSAALSNVPQDVVTALEQEMVELERRYARGDWGPAELNGGRLAEALFRYLEWKQSGSATPIGTSVNRTQVSHRVQNDSALPEGVRFHVLRCAELLMDVRNKRDVAHLGTEVDVKEMDAELVMRLASWSLSEIVREEGGLAAADAQALIDRFSSTHVPLVEEIDGDLLVLATELDAKSGAMVALYHAYPDALALETVRRAIRYQNKSRFRDDIIGDHVASGHVHLKAGRAWLTRKGAIWTERNVEFRLEID